MRRHYVSECAGTQSSFGVSGGTALCLGQVQNALNWLLAFVLPLDSITKCYVLIRALPSGLPQLRFYVHLNVSRAMTHAAELFCSFFFFLMLHLVLNQEEKRKIFASWRAGQMLSTPVLPWGPQSFSCSDDSAHAAEGASSARGEQASDPGKDVQGLKRALSLKQEPWGSGFISRTTVTKYHELGA